MLNLTDLLVETLYRGKRRLKSSCSDCDRPLSPVCTPGKRRREWIGGGGGRGDVGAAYSDPQEYGRRRDLERSGSGLSAAYSERGFAAIADSRSDRVDEVESSFFRKVVDPGIGSSAVSMVTLGGRSSGEKKHRAKSMSMIDGYIPSKIGRHHFSPEPSVNRQVRASAGQDAVIRSSRNGSASSKDSVIGGGGVGGGGGGGIPTKSSMMVLSANHRCVLSSRKGGANGSCGHVSSCSQSTSPSDDDGVEAAEGEGGVVLFNNEMIDNTPRSTDSGLSWRSTPGGGVCDGSWRSTRGGGVCDGSWRSTRGGGVCDGEKGECGSVRRRLCMTSGATARGVRVDNGFSVSNYAGRRSDGVGSDGGEVAFGGGFVVCKNNTDEVLRRSRLTWREGDKDFMGAAPLKHVVSTVTGAAARLRRNRYDRQFRGSGSSGGRVSGSSMSISRNSSEFDEEEEELSMRTRHLAIQDAWGSENGVDGVDWRIESRDGKRFHAGKTFNCDSCVHDKCVSHKGEEEEEDGATEDEERRENEESGMTEERSETDRSEIEGKGRRGCVQGTIQVMEVEAGGFDEESAMRAVDGDEDAEATILHPSLSKWESYVRQTQAVADLAKEAAALAKAADVARVKLESYKRDMYRRTNTQHYINDSQNYPHYAQNGLRRLAYYHKQTESEYSWSHEDDLNENVDLPPSPLLLSDRHRHPLLHEGLGEAQTRIGERNAYKSALVESVNRQQRYFPGYSFAYAGMRLGGGRDGSMTAPTPLPSPFLGGGGLGEMTELSYGKESWMRSPLVVDGSLFGPRRVMRAVGSKGLSTMEQVLPTPLPSSPLLRDRGRPPAGPSSNSKGDDNKPVVGSEQHVEPSSRQEEDATCQPAAVPGQSCTSRPISDGNRFVVWKTLLDKAHDPGRDLELKARAYEIDALEKKAAMMRLTREHQMELKRQQNHQRQETEAAKEAKQRETSSPGEKSSASEKVSDAALIELSKEAEFEVSKALGKGNGYGNEILVFHQGSNIQVSRTIMQCLCPGAWLNDEVINVYLELLKERERRNPGRFPVCHFLNSFFFNKLSPNHSVYDYKAVRRWTTYKKLGYYLVDCDKVIVPIHLKIHWCLAIINVRDSKLEYYDSLGGQVPNVLENLARYIEDEARDKCAREVKTSSWERVYLQDIPAQMNGCDCGVFMVKYADYESRDAPFNFSQAHMSYFRRRMVWEILRLRVE